MNNIDENTAIDYQKVFESSPNLYLLLSPDLIIIGGSDAYIEATLTRRKEITGRALFDVFPDNPDDPSADGVSNLSASLTHVLRNKQPHAMAVQKYDIRRPDGTFEERYWSPLNRPVLNGDNEVMYIIHKVEDVTELERMKKESEIHLQKKKELEEQEKIKTHDLIASEKRFVKIFNASPIALVITDAASGKLMHVNESFEETFRVKSNDVIGRTLTEIGLADEKGREAMAKKVREKGGHSVQADVRMKDINGNEKRILVSTEIIEIDHKECFLKAMINITERKKMEEEIRQLNTDLEQRVRQLKESEEKFQKAFKSSAAGISITRLSDSKYLDVNDAFVKLVGYTKREVLNRTSAELGLIIDISKREEILQQVRDSGTAHNFEMAVRHRSGRILEVLASIDTILLNGEKYAINIIYDITERKRAEQDLQALNKELESFSYSVSHDLRAPLRAVSGFARILQEDYSPVFDEEGKRLLNTISKNAEKMGVLIDDLLSFSRLGRKELHKKETDLNAIAESVVSESGKTFGAGARIEIDKLPVVIADPALIKQVMTNLIGNAVKYSSKAENPLVKISAENAESEIIISVKDNGVGFDMRYADKLFGVFQRLHTMEEFEGTGVGLAIVQKIINKHGGRVWAEGKINEGATFNFSLPVITLT